MLTLLGPLLVAQDLTHLLPLVVPNFLGGMACDKWSQKYAIGIVTEGLKGCGSAKEGPLKQLGWGQSRLQRGGAIPIEPWDNRPAWWLFWASRQAEAAVDLCPGGAP